MFASSKTASVSGGYQISRSLRFNSADSAYLNRTPASASNQKTWSWSGWVKRSKLGSAQTLMSQGETYIDLNGSDQVEINLRTGGTNYLLGSTAVYRDPSAWYHIVVVCDTTNATAADRLKLWVNNVQVTSYVYSSYTSIPQNQDTGFNAASVHRLGSSTLYGEYLGGYMTEVNFIDGSQLTPSSFGETNAQTGVWQPKAYSGSYGTNGFYLNFSDNSNTTAATLGKDYSGNGNNWTPNNFSVTAGAGNDSLVDSPTSYGTDTGVGGTVRGNYCTLNPLNSASGITNGNLDFLISNNTAYGSVGISSSKWYWETTVNNKGDNVGCGISPDSLTITDRAYLGTAGSVYCYFADGTKYNGSSATAYGATFTTGDIIGTAVDLDAGTITFYKNGSSQGTAFTGLTGGFKPQVNGYLSNPSVSLNFGQRPFAYTAPSGYKALCTQNLPTPAIGATTATQAGKYYNAVTYTGTGSSNSVTGVGFQPDWTWIKSRSNGAYHHRLVDAVRGVTKEIYSNLTNAEGTDSNGLTAFGSDGFTLGSSNEYNASGSTFVAWNWKANGSGSTNTSGSITSTVSANTTSGFSVVTYTGTGTTGTIGHGLGVAPSMVIVKCRSTATTNWYTYHISIGNTGALGLNLTDATITSSSFWNNTSPTSSVFTLSGASGELNGSGRTYVAYAFAEVAGYSKFGSYTGNGSADGPFVYCGFRPAYLLVKRSDSTYDWWVFDNKRLGYNATSYRLAPDLSNAEYTTGPILDLTSNGFKIRDTSQGWNGSGGTIIFAAFAESPFKYGLAR